MTKKFMETEGRLPLLTIVVPVYNGKDYVRDTVKSILKTDYPQIELLLVDDGSTDVAGWVSASQVTV